MFCVHSTQGFDGGDCCECDCQQGNSGYECGALGFACVGPSSTCVDDDDYIEGACGNRDDMGNGRCDLENNVEGCGACVCSSRSLAAFLLHTVTKAKV